MNDDCNRTIRGEDGKKREKEDEIRIKDEGDDEGVVYYIADDEYMGTMRCNADDDGKNGKRGG